MVAQTKEEIAEDMELDPELWAELYLEQREIIKTLSQIVEDYKARLELLLIDPDEDSMH